MGREDPIRTRQQAWVARIHLEPDSPTGPVPPSSTCHARRTYFRQILACRRRVQKQWENAPVTRVFRLGNEFHPGPHAYSGAGG